MKKTISLLFAALFLLLCLIPSVGMLLFGESRAGANEVLASAPSLRNRDGTLNGGCLQDFSDYIGDRFFLRQELITAWNGLNAVLFRTSASPEVVLGKDGWLYYAETAGDYTRLETLSERELWCAARTVRLMEEYAAAQCCDFLFTLAPNKNSLYPAHMPDWPVGEGESSAGGFRRLYAAMGGNYLDLFAVFAREGEELYYRTDSHWNGKGAALAADAMLTALGREGDWTAGGFVSAAPHRGDLYEMLYPAGVATEEDYAAAAGFTYTHTRPFRGSTDLKIETVSERGQGSLLCFRDSFGNNSFPYLAEKFSTALFSRQNAYDLTAIARCGADTVIIELVERNLRYLLDYDPVYLAPERDEPLRPRAEAPEGEMQVTRQAEGGLLSVSGALPTAADDHSPVYLRCGGVLYEATPRPAGYHATLPAHAETEGAQLIYFSEGTCVFSRLSVIEKE